MQLIRVSASGSESKVTASPLLFNDEVSERSLAQALRVYLSNERQATSKTKSRGEVARTKKKLYKQKGTGGARHGARSAPLFVGGGVAHGPKGIENWSRKLSKKHKKQSLTAALSVQADTVRIIDEFSVQSGKTSDAVKVLQHVQSPVGLTLVITPDHDVAYTRVMANIPLVECRTAEGVTARDVLAANRIVVTEAALHALELRLQARTKGDATEKPVVKKTPKAPSTIKTTKKVSTKKKAE